LKLKAAEAGLSEACVEELNRLRPRVLKEVLVPHLKVSPTFGPSEFYVQKCDEADASTHKPFCEVRLSGVSVNDERSVNDFSRCRTALEQVYADVITKHHPGEEIELTTIIMLDAPLKNSALVEGSPCELPLSLH
jgi:hypothetical protein